MREFSLTSFATFLGALAVVEHVNHEALEHAAVIVETEAKRVIGTYDYGWPPLKPETIAKKTTGDSPLLETGEMRDSIEHVSDHEEAVVGSNNDKALWHELGTKKIPPRSFLGEALIRKTDEVVQMIGRRIVGHLSGAGDGDKLT